MACTLWIIWGLIGKRDFFNGMSLSFIFCVLFFCCVVDGELNMIGGNVFCRDRKGCFSDDFVLFAYAE